MNYKFKIFTHKSVPKRTIVGSMVKQKITFLLLHPYAFLNSHQHHRYAITQKPLICHQICAPRKLKRISATKKFKWRFCGCEA